MAFEVEKEWITNSGLKAVAIMVNGSHRCGYVGVPPGHELFGKKYRDHVDPKFWPAIENADEPFKGSPIDLLLASFDAQEKDTKGPQISYLINVHGGVTYSGGSDNYPVKGDEWWFGFDCNHSGDKNLSYDSFDPEAVHRTLDYVESECESMAEQIQKVGCEMGATK